MSIKYRTLLAWAVILVPRYGLAVMLERLVQGASPVWTDAITLYLMPVVLTITALALGLSKRKTLMGVIVSALVGASYGTFLATPGTGLGAGVAWAGRIYIELLQAFLAMVTIALAHGIRGAVSRTQSP